MFSALYKSSASALRTNIMTAVRANYSSASQALPTFETLVVSVPSPYVYHVELNRPKNFNAFNKKLWIELGDCFKQLSVDSDCRVVVLSGQGKHFTAGIDLQDMMVVGQQLAELEDVARKCRFMEQMIELYQNSITSLETCVKPVLSVVHNACIGAGVDLITASDIRYCTKDTWFEVKEVDIGMAADVGTLQRLPKIIGNMSIVRELCYTGRKVKGPEALEIGLVSKLFDDKDSALKEALEVATTIAAKSPVAVQTTKRSLVYSLNKTNQEGLDHIKTLNQTMLLSEDFVSAVMAQATKGEKPVFSKL